MKKEQISRMRELRQQGKTFQQIADEIGCTRQYVQLLLAKKYKRPSVLDGCIYPGLKAWMMENNVRISDMVSGSSLQKVPAHTTLSNTLKGKVSPTKETIDFILAVTGLTYEQCFGGGNDGSVRERADALRKN